MYRDSDFLCPQCGITLEALDDRDKWRCKQCVGTLVGVAQVEVELGTNGRHALFTAAKRAREGGERPCPRCRVLMEPVNLIGIEIDRCMADGFAWFDRGELGRAAQELTSEVDAAASAFLAALMR